MIFVTFAEVEVGTVRAGEPGAPNGLHLAVVALVVVVEDFFVDVVFHPKELALARVLRQGSVAAGADVEVGDVGGLEPGLVQLDGEPTLVAVYFVGPLVVQLPQLVPQRKPPGTQVVVAREYLHFATPRQQQVDQLVNLVY